MGLGDILKKLFPPSEDTRETEEPSSDDSSSNEDVSENGEDPTGNNERNGSTEQDSPETESSTTEETQENDPQEVEEEEDSGGGGAKKLVCKGAMTSCNSSETPMQIPLKIISQDKFFINDSAGSEKLIASTMELPQPFDAPFFGKCKLQPAGNSFLPCSVAITKWQNAYEDVELSNGGKILTEDSTAICSFGGTIKIEKHGQGSAQINESQVENGSTSASTTLNPLVDSSAIEVLAGGNLDDNDIDEKGAAVKKIAATDGKTAFAKGTWISFKVTEWYNASATNKDKVNWQVKDAAGSSVQDFVDKGESIAIHFAKNGIYTVEAYGGSAGGTNAAASTITIKNPELGAITKTTADKIRIGESATFAVAPDVGKPDLFSDSDDVVWKLYKSTNGGRTYTEETSIIDLRQGSQQTIPFTEKGHYLIKATINGKTVEEKIEATTNYVNVIEADKDAMRTNTDSITFKVKDGGYNLYPATASEKQTVKWVVYDKDRKKLAEYSDTTGETFTLSNVKTEGVFYVEAFMNSSEIGKVTSSKTPASIVKIEVTAPRVKLLKWTDKEGHYKQKCGFDEDMYVNVELNAFNGEKVKLHFYNVQSDNTTTLIAKSGAITVSNKGTVIYKINFSKDYYKKKLKNANEEGTGYVVYEVLPYDKNEILKDGKAGLDFTHGMKLNIKNKSVVSSAYFEKDQKKIKNVPFGKTITCYLTTYNLIGKKINIQLYREESLMGQDLLWPDPKIETYIATVDSQGRASFDILVEKDFNGSSTRGKFYLKLEDVKWQSEAQKNQAFFIGYTKNDKLENQVNPVVKEKANGTNKKKKGRCKNCNKDITLAEIKGVYSNLNETGLQAAIDFLNAQRSFFGLTTCTRKAHFLAQLAAESGFSSMEESFKYQYEGLREVGLLNFNATNDPNRTKAKLWAYGYNGRTKAQITNADERSIANWAYGKLPKSAGLGNTAITSNWSDETADGWKYRGSGFIQLTGKSNFSSTSNLYNNWIATDNSGISKEDLVANPDKLRTDKSIAMAAALIYWKNNNLLTRSDMGLGDDALGAITYKINSAFVGWAHRETYLEKAVKALKVEDCEDYTRRKSEKGSVVVVSGTDTKIKKYNGAENVVYNLSVYRALSLKKYNELKANNNLPIPDYTEYITRDAHQTKSDRLGKTFKHSNFRYGQYNECPPGNEYYLNSSKDASGPTYLMYVSDEKIGSDIKVKDELKDFMDVKRDGIAIHNWDRKGSIGCMTTCSENKAKNSKAEKLYNEIPDLFLHHVMEGKTRKENNTVHDMSIERREVRIIIEERDVIEEEWENAVNGSTRWVGKK